MTLIKNYWLLNSFCAVFLTTSYWPTMPSIYWLFAIFILIVASFRIRWAQYFMGISLAVSIILIKGNAIDEQSRTILKNESDITIKIRADSYFKQNSYGFSGEVSILSLKQQIFPSWRAPKVYLYSPVYLPIGSVATVTVRFKPIWGLLNEAGFDSETYYLSRGIVAKASVRPETLVQIENSGTFRYRLYTQVSQLIAACHYPALIKALTFADRTSITADQWTLLQHTGLAHLMAISGLHVGIAFLIGWMVGRSLAWFSRYTLWLPLFLGFSLAFIYAWLAGFSLTTLRALVMVGFNGGVLLLGIRMSVIQRYLLTLALILCLDPFCCYATGFWLSFLAVLFVFSQSANLSDQRHPVTRWVLSYVGLSLCLLPVSAYYLGGISLVSPLYNMVFIPWFTFVVVPLLFFVLILTVLGLSSMACWGWMVVDSALRLLMMVISFGKGGWIVSSTTLTICLTLVVILWLGGRFFHLRFRMLIGSVALLFAIYRHSEPGWRIDILDVGQGLAVLIERSGHAVLYDTGKSWPGGSMAQAVISPILEKRGITQLDGLILSHLDDDHAGGRRFIERRWRPQWKWSGQSVVSYQSCVQGRHLYWQGLRFDVLWPPEHTRNTDNAQSCVVRIYDADSGRGVVLTGDIDKRSEWQMIRQFPTISANVLIVPHHGSQTSSSTGLIRAVNPTWAVASLAMGNPWRFPNPNVVNKYVSHGITWFDTAMSGQITVKFYANNHTLSTIRRQAHRPWYRHMLRKRVE